MTKQAPTPEETETKQTIDTTATEANVPAVRDEATLAVQEDWGTIEFGDYAPPDERGAIPVLSLNRKLDGGFLLEDTGELTNEILFVWLARGASRAWWPEAYGKGDAAPACRSADAITPDASSPDRQSDVCVTCPHSAWTDSQAPECRSAVEAFVFVADDATQLAANEVGAGRLARIRFGGLAFAPAADYWRSFARRVGADGRKRPPISVITRCTLVATDTKNGKFLVPKFERAHELSFAQTKFFDGLRSEHTSAWKSYVAEDVATGAGHVDDNGSDDGTAAQPVVLDDGEAF